MPPHTRIYIKPHTTGSLSLPSATIPCDTRTSINFELSPYTLEKRPCGTHAVQSASDHGSSLEWARGGGRGEASKCQWLSRCGASVPSVPRGLIPRTCLPAVSWYQLCDVKRRVDVALTDYQNTSLSPSLCLKMRPWLSAGLMRGNRFRMSDCV